MEGNPLLQKTQMNARPLNVRAVARVQIVSGPALGLYSRRRARGMDMVGIIPSEWTAAVT